MPNTDSVVDIEQPTARETEDARYRQRPCARARARVLLVEDDAAVAALFAEILGDEGFAVTCADGPHDALALLATSEGHAIDVILSAPFAASPSVPYAWLDRLRGATAAAVVICARCPALFYPDHRRRGYAGFLEEPCDVQGLIDAVEYACAQRAPGLRPSPAPDWRASSGVRW